MIAFVLVFLALFVGSHAYVWHRLAQAPAWPLPLARLVAAILLAGAIGAPVMLTRHRLLGPDGAGLGFALGLYWLGCFFFLFVSTALFHALAGVAGLVADAFAGANPAADAARRLAFARTAAIGAVLLAAAMAGTARWSVAAGPHLRSLDIVLPRLPAALDGLRIVQVSDLHVAPLLRRAYVDNVVEQVQRAQPDVIVLTGDLIDGTVAELEADIAPLARLEAPKGVFMITGNHEYYSGADAWLAHLRTLGIRPLRNEHAELGRAGASLVLAGIDDWTAHHFGGGHGADLPRALAGVARDTPVVLLAHQPRAIDQAAEAGVDLMLSGHTHGGQLWPFGALVRLVQPYLRGLYRHNERTQIYVHPGTGYWGPPMRLGAKAEIALLILRAPTA